jgi:NAD(P)-dependent dehydrogenase (short-subunit alcohol dehydrogenase family)
MKYEIIQMLKQEPLPVKLDFQKQRGSIVNTASLSGIAVLPTLSAYNSSKHATVQMSAVNAREYAPDLIRVNTVCPGFVETPMLRGSSLSAEFLEMAKAQCPANRILNPLEIAQAIVFLSGSGASGITGVNLSVDGGANLFHII